MQFDRADEPRGEAAGQGTLSFDVSDARSLHAELEGRVHVEGGPEVYWYGRREFAGAADRRTICFAWDVRSDPPMTIPLYQARPAQASPISSPLRHAPATGPGWGFQPAKRRAGPGHGLPGRRPASVQHEGIPEMLMPFFHSRRDDRSARRLHARRRRFLVEPLEGRQMLSTFTVTNTNDSGAGSLRQAIVNSNGTSGNTNAISFNIPGTGVETINLLSALPTLSQPLKIDGTTEPNSGGQPVIQIDGTKAGSGVVGLDLASSASGSTLKGLSITDFSGGGVVVNGASNVSITTDDIGLVKLSAGAVVHGNTFYGVLLEGGANHDTLSLDVISGQVDNGVEILGTGTKNNTVETSEIGTDPTGTASVDQNGGSLANTGNGVEIFDGASDNTLTGDVISNNGNYGVYISDPTTSGNVVEGSVIGTNAAGSAALPNDMGVLITSGANDSTIGGTTVAARDVISGNRTDGVHIVNDSTGNVVEGDYIGISRHPRLGVTPQACRLPWATGLAAWPSTPARATTRSAGRRPVPATSFRPTTSMACIISGAGTTGNFVEGDFIGTDPSGSRALPNVDGVAIQNGATNNTVGNTVAAART